MRVNCDTRISLFITRLFNYMIGRITQMHDKCKNKIIHSKNQIQISLNIIRYFSNLFKNLILLHLRI